MHDWKVGDKFTLEFEVVGYAGVGFIMAKGAGFNLIIGDEMREAKLIQPKPEKPKPEIKVGQVWRTRGGREVNVPRFTKSDDYPVVCAYGEKEYVVSPSGKWSSHVDSAFDLVELVQDAPEPQKLDVTKPIREKSTCMVLEYLTTDIIGTIWTKTPSGNVQAFQPSDLENIPIPKIKGRRLALLLQDGSVYWGDNAPDSAWSRCRSLDIVGYKMVEIEAGDGMGGES